MGKISFILGGARSGKSSYAVELAKEAGNRVAFVATCPYYDQETEERIALHKKERPSDWKTFEEYKDVAPVLANIDTQDAFDAVLIDCLTLFTSNLLMDNYEENDVKERINTMLDVLKEAKYDSILVANEVGLGIVPEHKLARKFRDVAGRVNQLVAKHSDKVVFMAAGLPLHLKG